MSKDHNQHDADPEAMKALLQVLRSVSREVQAAPAPALSAEAQGAVDAYANLSLLLAVDRFVPRNVDPKQSEEDQRKARQHNAEAEAFTKIVQAGK